MSLTRIFSSANAETESSGEAAVSKSCAFPSHATSSEESGILSVLMNTSTKVITFALSVFSPKIIRLQNASRGYQPVVTAISSIASAMVEPLPETKASALFLDESVDCGTDICAVTSYFWVLSTLSIPNAIIIAVFSISISPKLLVRNKSKVNPTSMGKNFVFKNFIIRFPSFL